MTTPPKSPARQSVGIWSRSEGARILAGLLLLLLSAAWVQAQTTFWIAPGTGSFVNMGNWSNGEPNNATSASIINGTIATPTTVQLAGASGSVLNLTLGSHDTLDVNLNSTLSVYGTSIANGGAINVIAGSANNTYLNLENNVTLSGTGILNLSYGDHNGNAFVEESGGTYTLTNSGSTIQGDGIIGNGGLTLVNGAGGTVNANVSSQSLTLNGTGGITNAGVLEATGGGVLQISSNVANAGGAITANNSTVNVGAAVTGGQLSTSGTGVLETSGSAALTNVTITSGSTYTSPLNTTTALTGTITNDGSLQLNAGSATNTYLEIDANTTLQGGGTVTLNSGDTNGLVYVQENGTNLTLTNANNLIEGYGSIGDGGGLALVNSAPGTINANVSGRTLTLNGAGGITNAGLLEATLGGTLQISTAVNNAGGTITANAGTVAVSSTIQGGTLTAAGGGLLETGGTATLDGSTQGPITVSSGTTYTSPLNTGTSVQGTVVIDGNIQLNAGSATNTELNIVANTTLQGPGTVTLNSGDNNGQVYIQESGGSYTLTNKVTIEGYGVIGNSALTLVNSPGATIEANVTGETLTINPGGGFTNSGGTLEASGGGILALSGSILENGGGTIEVNGANSVVQFVNGATIQGGTLTTVNSGTLGVPNTSITLDGSTEGALTISPGSVYNGALNTNTSLVGAIDNLGTIQLLAGSANNTEVTVVSPTTLQGGGTVTLNSGDNNGQVYIETSTAGTTLTNVDNLIQGYGVIGNSGLVFVNQTAGTVDANAAAGTLLLNGSGNITNAGLLEATNGGTLQIQNVVENAGANITANGGTVLIDAGGTIRGGTLNSLGGGTLGLGTGSATLDGSASALTLSTGSTWTAGLGSQTTVLGTVVNQGNFQINAGSATNTILNLSADTTLQGGGTLTLNSGDTNGHAYLQTSVPGTTLTNVDNLLQGYGVIGNSDLVFVNEAGGAVNANIPFDTLLLNGSGNVINSGLLEATNGGILQITNVVENTGANITADGGTVLIDGGATIRGGTLNSLDEGTLGLGTGTAILDGTANALTLSAGSTWTAGLGSQTTVLGTIVNQGNFQLSAGSATNTILNIGANTTLQGGGTVTLNSGDNNGQVYVQTSNASVLTDQDNTIQGYGVIGNGGLALTVANAASVNANAEGQVLLLNGAGGVANSGTLEATNGGILQLATVVSNAGIVSANGGTVDVIGGTVQGGTLSGPTLETTSSATLDGSTNGALTLAPASAFTGAVGSTTTLLGVIINQGTIQINAGSANSTYLNFSADTTLQGGGTLILNSGDNNGQAYLQESADGVTLTNVDNVIEGYGIIGNSGLALINAASGTIQATGAGDTLTINTSGTVTNNGTFGADNAVLALTSNPSNLAANTLTGGTWMAAAGGTISFSGTTVAIVTNDATLVLNGNGSDIQTRTGSGGTYQTLEQTLVTNGGTLAVTGNRNFAAANGLTNNGVIQLGGGTFTAPALTDGPGGSLIGFGTFAPTGGVAIANGAIVSPGSALTNQQIATLTFGTPLTLGSGGVFTFDLKNGPSAVAGTDYDTVVVTGALTISATPVAPFSVALTSINPTSGNPGLANFNPTQAYSWTLVSAGSISGFSAADFSFNTSGFQNSLDGGTFLVGQSGNTLTLDFVPVPEPATWALMIGGLAVVALTVCRRASASGSARRP